MAIQLHVLSEDINGFVAASLVDSESGLALATEAISKSIPIPSAGNTEILLAKRNTMQNLGIDDDVEDILITLSHQYHLIRPLKNNPALFLYVVLDQNKANLAMARHMLKNFENNLDFS